MDTGKMSCLRIATIALFSFRLSDSFLQPACPVISPRKVSAISNMGPQRYWPIPSRPSTSFSVAIDGESSKLETTLPKLTILIPAYNEEFRIRDTLDSYVSYLETEETYFGKDRCSILVVDDGSSDATTRVVQDFAINTIIPLQCIGMESNAGKGGALAFGIHHISKTEPSNVRCLVLTADADGSASIENLPRMMQAMNILIERQGIDMHGLPDGFECPILVNGYRTYASAAAGRLVFRWGFRLAVRLIVGDLAVRDSQCGFKLMTLPAAEQLYTNLHLTGWGHDVEVLYRASKQKTLIAEEQVEWEDKDGSKLAASPGGVIGVAMRMFWEVMQVRLGYTFGGWEVEPAPRSDNRNTTVKSLQ